MLVEEPGVAGGEPAVVREQAAPEVLAGHLLTADVDLTPFADPERSRAVAATDLQLQRREGLPTEPSRRRTAGSVLAIASR